MEDQFRPSLTFKSLIGFVPLIILPWMVTTSVPIGKIDALLGPIISILGGVTGPDGFPKRSQPVK